MYCKPITSISALVAITGTLGCAGSEPLVAPPVVHIPTEDPHAAAASASAYRPHRNGWEVPSRFRDRGDCIARYTLEVLESEQDRADQGQNGLDYTENHEVSEAIESRLVGQQLKIAKRAIMAAILTIKDKTVVPSAYFRSLASIDCRHANVWALGIRGPDIQRYPGKGAGVFYNAVWNTERLREAGLSVQLAIRPTGRSRFEGLSIVEQDHRYNGITGPESGMIVGMAQAIVPSDVQTDFTLELSYFYNAHPVATRYFDYKYLGWDNLHQYETWQTDFKSRKKP